MAGGWKKNFSERYRTHRTNAKQRHHMHTGYSILDPPIEPVFSAVQGLQEQLQRAEPLPYNNGMDNQCVDFSFMQQISSGFILGGSYHLEDK